MIPYMLSSAGVRCGRDGHGGIVFVADVAQRATARRRPKVAWHGLMVRPSLCLAGECAAKPPGAFREKIPQRKKFLALVDSLSPAACMGETQAPPQALEL